MSNNSENNDENDHDIIIIDDNEQSAIEAKKEKFPSQTKKKNKEKVDKDEVPNFFPTFRVKSALYPVPILIVVILSGILAYVTYVEAGIQIEGGYISEEEYGATAGLLNGIIFVAVAAISSFIIIFLIKKGGINVLKYIFGFSFGFLSFFLTLFFGEIILFIIFYNLEPSEFIYTLYYSLFYLMLVGIAIFTVLMLYKYFTADTYYIKNFLVLYIGLMTGALLGVIMPLWTTLAILIGISLWDIFAVKSKRGPIKRMMDIVSAEYTEEVLSEEEIKEKIEYGEIEYDTSKLEIGIGDLAFYSMLTSSALIQSGNLIVMILTSIAIIIGTGITISGLKRNKILPGLPISIFLGIGTMLLSWYILEFIMC